MFGENVDLARQNQDWVDSRRAFEALVNEIKRLDALHRDGNWPEEAVAEVERLKLQLPLGLRTDIYMAFAIASGRATIDELFDPKLVSSIEEDTQRLKDMGLW